MKSGLPIVEPKAQFRLAFLTSVRVFTGRMHEAPEGARTFLSASWVLGNTGGQECPRSCAWERLVQEGESPSLAELNASN